MHEASKARFKVVYDNEQNLDDRMSINFEVLPRK